MIGWKIVFIGIACWIGGYFCFFLSQLKSIRKEMPGIVKDHLILLIYIMIGFSVLTIVTLFLFHFFS